MNARLYLVDVIGAQESRERQALRDKKHNERRKKIDQRKPPEIVKRKAEKPAKKINYKRETVPYQPDLKSQFYDTKAWQVLRYKAFKLYGRRCVVCGAAKTELHVDHIKPRSKRPDLELDITNLQILCRDCNLGKGNSDSIDWR